MQIPDAPRAASPFGNSDVWEMNFRGERQSLGGCVRDARDSIPQRVVWGRKRRRKRISKRKQRESFRISTFRVFHSAATCRKTRGRRSAAGFLTILIQLKSVFRPRTAGRRRTASARLPCRRSSRDDRPEHGALPSPEQSRSDRTPLSPCLPASSPPRR